MSAQRILVIANPVAGRGIGKRLAPRLVAALLQHNIQVTLHFARGVGDAANRAREAGAENWTSLVVVGGDGTVNEVLNGLTDFSKPLGVLPTGTANVLAIELQLPKNPERAAGVIAAGHTRSIAVGVANNRRFLLFCGVGFDGAVAERQHKFPSGVTGKLKWAAPIFHTARRWPAYSLTVSLAGGRVIENVQSVIVARVRNYGGVLHMTPDISINSGQLHVMCFRMSQRRQWTWKVLRALVGQLRSGPLVEVHTVSALQIFGAAPYQLDGDFCGTTPIDLSLSVTHAQFFAPPV